MNNPALPLQEFGRLRRFRGAFQRLAATCWLAGLIWCAVLAPVGAQVTNLFEGFEGNFPEDNGWSVGDSNPSGSPAYWNDVYFTFGTVHTAHSGNWKGYCAATGYNGPTTAPLYTNFMTTYMSKTLDLKGYSSVTLSFWHLIPGIESCCDNASVYIDGGREWYRNSSVPIWTQQTVDLTYYATTNHTLRFEFYSDASINYEGWYLDDITVFATGPAPVYDVLWSVAITNYTGYVIDSDANMGDPTYNRDAILAKSIVRSDNFTNSASTHSYSLSYRLLDASTGLPHPIKDSTGVTNANYTYNLTNTVVLPAFSNAYRTNAAALRPVVKLNPYRQYTVECQVFTNGVTNGQFLVDGPRSYYHFTNLLSSDAALNVIASLDSATWNRTYMVNTVPGKDSFLVDVNFQTWRWDGFSNTLAWADIPLRLDFALTNAAGSQVPLASSNTNFLLSMLNHDASSPLLPWHVSTVQTVSVQPSNQLDSVSNTYYLTVTISHTNQPGQPSVAGNSTNTPLQTLLHFNGHLLFGGVDTMFTNINNVPWPGAPGAGWMNTMLSVDGNSGKVTGSPTHTYGSGVPLDVRLYQDGHAELNSGSVTLTGPSPDRDMVANVRFARGTVTLDTTGAKGGITAFLPTGFGYRTNDLSSKIIFYKIPFGTLTLDGGLNSINIPRFTPPGGVAYFCEESKPVWVQCAYIDWQIAAGKFVTPNGPMPIYVRAAEYAKLAAVSNLLVNPPEMAVKRANDRYFEFLSNVSGKATVMADSHSCAQMSAMFNFSPGSFLAHFPYDTAFQWGAAGSMQVSNDLVTSGAVSMLGNLQPVFVPYSGACASCNGSGSSALSTPGIQPDSGTLYFTVDGGLAGAGVLLPGPINLQWGLRPDTYYAQQALAFTRAAVHMPGAFLRGDQNTIGSPEGPANILYTGVNANDLDQIERPLTTSYNDGFADYAGLNFRCDDVHHPGMSSLGNTANLAWSLTGRSKYYVRYAGVSGIHEAEPGTLPTPPGTLFIYGYAFGFSNYGMSYLDSEMKQSLVSGSLTIPYPSLHVQNFDELRFDCLGSLQSATVPASDGAHKLSYWNADFYTLAINFQRNDECIPGDGALTLGVKAFATPVPDPLYGTLGFQANGNLIPKSYGLANVDSRLKAPNNISISGPNGVNYNFTPTMDAYFNSYSGSPPSPGWMNFAGKMDVPFFEDMKLHLHTGGSSNYSTSNPLYLAGGWPRVGTTNGNHGWLDSANNSYFSTNYFDWDNLGYPQGVVTVDDYRNNPSSEEYHPRAQRLWLGLIEFDYPMQWDTTLHAFKSFHEITNDLFVIKVQHQAKYIDAKQAELDFGAQYDGLPTISVANLAFNAVDGALGVSQAITEAASQPIQTALTSGLDEFDQILDTNMKRLFDGVFDQAVDPLIHSFYVQLTNDWAGLVAATNQALFVSNVTVQATNFFIGGTGGAVSSNLSSVLLNLANTTGGAGQLLAKLDNYLRDITNAIDAITGTISQTNGISFSPAVPGLLGANTNGSIPMQLVTRLIGNLAADFLDATVGPELQSLIDKANPTLTEIATVLNDAKATLMQVRAQLEPAAEFARELDSTLKSFSTDLTNVSVQVSLNVSNYFAGFDYSVDDPFRLYTEDQIKQAIRQQVEDAFFGSAPAAQIQVVLRQRLYDLDTQMKTAMDSVFQQLNSVMRDLISQSLAEVDDTINGLLGDVGANIGAGKINGHAVIDGDSLSLLRIDGHFEWDAAGKLSFDAYLQIKELTSDGSPGCSSSSAPATEVTLGAANVTCSWLSPDLSVSVETKFTFDGTHPYPVNFAGSLALNGELDYEAFQLYNLAAALSFGAYENYLALRGGIKFSGYDFSGGIFFGRTCTLDPIKLLDPDVAGMLGSPPFTGAYCYGQGWIPVSEVVLGIPASCMFTISAGVGAGAFFFLEGPTYGGKMFLGISGEALCLVSIGGDVTMIGVKHGTDLEFKGTGHFEAEVGPCPFCYTWSKSVGIQFKNLSWHIDY